MKVAVLSGSGRYQDQWHDFTATSVEVERALSPLDLDVVVRAIKPSSVRDVRDADLLVVNAGCGEFHESSDGPEEAWGEVFATLRDHVRRGRPVLALHAASNTLDGLADWHRWIGGRWDPDASGHPPIGPARIEVTDPGHPLTQGLEAFEVYDERYCGLQRFPGSHVLLHHEHEGVAEPIVWAVEQPGFRSVYDALGHDPRSFASPQRVDLLRREVRWLLRLG